MKFVKLYVSNFLTIGEAKLNIADQGLVLLQGQNRDDESASSNGAGKSSVPDALCWALYGTTARGESGDAVINAIAKKGCSVVVTIKDGDRIYRVARYRKHKDYKNGTHVSVIAQSDYKGDGTDAWTDLTRGTEKETQAVIDGLMGCSFNVFMAAIYAGQEAMPDLPKLTDKQLKLLIEEAAGVERLETAYNVARTKFNEATSKHQRAQMVLESFKTRLTDQHRRVITAEQMVNEFEVKRPALEVECLKQAESFKQQMIDTFAQWKAINVEALTVEREGLLKALAEADSVRKRGNEKRAELQPIRNALSVVRHQQAASENEIKAIAEQIRNAPEHMKEPCRECGKPHTPEELDDYIARAKAKLIEAKGRYDVAIKSIAELTDKANAVEAEVAKIESEVPDTTAALVRESEISKALAAADVLKRNIALFKARFDEWSKKAAETKIAINPYKELVLKENAALDQHKKEVENAQQGVELANEELAIANDVVQVFSPAGVRAHILDTVTPFLNIRTSEYLSALSEGNISAVWSTLAETAKGDTREKFNITVSNDKGAKSFGGLSGGEKRKVRLATMLALQDLVATRATKPIELWVGDEIDDALDPAGLERLMGILETKARERGTVLIISHNELSDWVDNIATVIKEGGKSHVEGVLNA